MNLLVCCLFVLVLTIFTNAQPNFQNFYSHPLKMLINKYPAYVNPRHEQPLTIHQPQIFIETLPEAVERITISGEKPAQIWKRRRAPIRITPFLYSINPVELDADKPVPH